MDDHLPINEFTHYNVYTTTTMTTTTTTTSFCQFLVMTSIELDGIFSKTKRAAPNFLEAEKSERVLREEKINAFPHAYREIGALMHSLG